MRCNSFVSAVTIVAFLATGVLPAYAQHGTATPADQPSKLRASMDREAAKAATQTVARPQKSGARRAMLQGGGGGGGMVVMALIGTVAGLAATYFVVKEMRRQNDELTNQPQ